ncbi:MAG: hypothetical protein HQL53_03180 [Magnetococcales bacterium]|nr:hypothetical protein [Magnetococcales bacterium]
MLIGIFLISVVVGSAAAWSAGEIVLSFDFCMFWFSRSFFPSFILGLFVWMLMELLDGLVKSRAGKHQKVAPEKVALMSKIIRYVLGGSYLLPMVAGTVLQWLAMHHEIHAMTILDWEQMMVLLVAPPLLMLIVSIPLVGLMVVGFLVYQKGT